MWCVYGLAVCDLSLDVLDFGFDRLEVAYAIDEEDYYLFLLLFFWR